MNRPSIRRQWLGIDILGCRFTDAYADHDLEVGSWLRWCFGLPQWHPCEIEEAFTEDLMDTAAARRPRRSRNSVTIYSKITLLHYRFKISFNNVDIKPHYFQGANHSMQNSTNVSIDFNQSCFSRNCKKFLFSCIVLHTNQEQFLT